MREFLVTFSLIFLAALPGRTTFVLVLLAASMRPWRILLGAIPAFTIQCALAVILGQGLRNLPYIYLQSVAALLFLFFAGKYWRESRKSDSLSVHQPTASIASLFMLFFVAELGDVSQLAIAARSTQSDASVGIFFGSAVAMGAIALLSVSIGRMLGSFVREATLQRIAAVAFGILGIFLLSRSILQIVS